MYETWTKEGRVDFEAPGSDIPCQTYYKIFGDLKSGVPPVVVLHGGPGSGHEYCLPFSKLWSLYGVPVVFYDQIGCASSTHLRHMVGVESFWTVDLFLAELKNLLNQLSIGCDDGPGFHILGHSWGGRLATFFAAQHASGLRKLIIVGTPVSGELFGQSMQCLTELLSTENQQNIEEAVKHNDFTTPGFRAAAREFSTTFMCRASPWPPEELAVNLRNQADDNTVRLTLFGPSAWVCTGMLRKLDATPLLSQINIPTLLMNGEFDTAGYECMVPYFNHVPRVRWITFPGGSHMLFLDSKDLQQKVLTSLRDFLRQDIA